MQIFATRHDLVAEAVNASNWVKQHSCDQVAVLDCVHSEHSYLISCHNIVNQALPCMHGLLILVQSLDCILHSTFTLLVLGCVHIALVTLILY